MIILSSFTIFKAVQPFAAQMEGHLYIPKTATAQELTWSLSWSLTWSVTWSQHGHSYKLQKGDDEPIENHNIIKPKIQCKNKNCIYRRVKNKIQ